MGRAIFLVQGRVAWAWGGVASFGTRSTSGPVLFQIFLNLDGGHAAASRGRDGLAITAVLHIAAGENAMHAGQHIIVSFEIAVGIGVQLPLEHLRVGVVPDAKKEGAGGEVPKFAGFDVAKFEAGDFILDGIVNILDGGVGEEVDLVIMLRANRVRKMASSMAESPPPTTTISLPEKKKPSQVAQEETPCPISFCSLGRPSQRAEAPLAMISVLVCT